MIACSSHRREVLKRIPSRFAPGPHSTLGDDREGFQ
jgi:hypothetical protein